MPPDAGTMALHDRSNRESMNIKQVPLVSFFFQIVPRYGVWVWRVSKIEGFHPEADDLNTLSVLGSGTLTELTAGLAFSTGRISLGNKLEKNILLKNYSCVAKFTELFLTHYVYNIIYCIILKL